MHVNPTPLFTPKDFSILEVMHERCLGRDDPLRPILSEKLSSAQIVFADDMPANVVTLNSRVRYHVDDNPAETRIVCHADMRGMVGLILPITHPRGLALLGLAENHVFLVERPGDVAEQITAHEVIYQPEAARRERSKLNGNGVPRLRLVHSSDAPALQSAAQLFSFHGPDDPGPSAA